MGRPAVLLRYGGLALLLGLLTLHADPAVVLVAMAAVVAGALLSRLLGAVAGCAVGSLSGPAVQALSASTPAHSQCDPDAAGRPRPRAPSGDPLTA